MEGLRPDLPLLLEAVNNVLITPSNFVGETLYCTIFPPWLQPQNPQSFWHNHPLLPVIERGDTLIEFQAFEGSGAASSLMRHHAPDGTEEDLGRSTVMERAGFFGVDDMAFVKKVVVAELVAEEAAGDVDLLASHNDDLLAVEDLLGYN